MRRYYIFLKKQILVKKCNFARGRQLILSSIRFNRILSTLNIRLFGDILTQQVKWLINPQYEAIYGSKNHLFVKENGKLGFVAKDGNVIIFPECDWVFDKK